MNADVQPSEARLLTDRLRNSVIPGPRLEKEQAVSEQDGNLQLVVEGGVLRQRLMADGRCQTTAIYYADDVINLFRFVRHEPNSDHLLALRGTVMASVAPGTVADLRDMSRSGIDGMAALVLRELGILQEHLICLGMRTALEGMAHFFCEAAVRLAKPGTSRQGQRLYLPLTQDALGGLLGLSSVHVNRTLQHLRATGFADFSNMELIIHDFEGLANLGEFDEGYLAPI